MDAQLDVGEVSAADLSTDLVEADSAADGHLAHHALVLGHVQVELLQRGQPPSGRALVLRGHVQAVLPAPACVALVSQGLGAQGRAHVPQGGDHAACGGPRAVQGGVPTRTHCCHLAVGCRGLSSWQRPHLLLKT